MRQHLNTLFNIFINNISLMVTLECNLSALNKLTAPNQTLMGHSSRTACSLLAAIKRTSIAADLTLVAVFQRSCFKREQQNTTRFLGLSKVF